MIEKSSPETADRVLRLLSAAGGPDESDNEITISGRDIARQLGIGRQTANRALARLRVDGRVELVRAGTGRDYPSVWRIR